MTGRRHSIRTTRATKGSHDVGFREHLELCERGSLVAALRYSGAGGRARSFPDRTQRTLLRGVRDITA
jgi:hypothetical protein